MAAEYAAYTAAASLANPTTKVTVLQDCAAVIADAGAPLRKSLRPNSKLDALRRTAAEFDTISAHLKVKGHDDAGLHSQDPRRRHLAWGNQQVDAAANEGRNRQPQPNHSLAESVKRDERCVKHIVALAAAILHLWPPVPKAELQAAKKFQKAAKKAAHWQPQAEHYHQWVQLPRCWQCAACGAMSRQKRKPTKEAHCKVEESFKLKDIIAHPQGHCLAAGNAGGILFLVCTTCGAEASGRPILLRQPCTGHRSVWREKQLRLLVEKGQLIARQHRQVDELCRVDGTNIVLYT